MTIELSRKKKLHGIKCLKCPYYLGKIKCLKDPCQECMKRKNKKHPFSDQIKAQ